MLAYNSHHDVDELVTGDGEGSSAILIARIGGSGIEAAYAYNDVGSPSKVFDDLTLSNQEDVKISRHLI